MMKLIEQFKCFSGYWQRFEHDSEACNCVMTFSVFFPFDVEHQSSDKTFSTVFWLSGLTCNDQNFVQKAACERYAVENQMILIAPDTSPRGVAIDGEDDDWDFGSGAGFYLDATRDPWRQNYNMYSYISDELYRLIVASFPVDPDKVGIMGHSMGGHGALTIGLKHPDKFKSVSAFAPICAPSKVPWGQKAFENYLVNFSESQQYDACALIRQGYRFAHAKIDQGKSDQFLEQQLSPDELMAVCHEAELPIELNIHDGYDHSYFFIRSFIGEHITYHKSQLNSQSG